MDVFLGVNPAEKLLGVVESGIVGGSEGGWSKLSAMASWRILGIMTVDAVLCLTLQAFSQPALSPPPCTSTMTSDRVACVCRCGPSGAA